jgi:hypothetical protein
MSAGPLPPPETMATITAMPSALHPPRHLLDPLAP